MQRNANFRQPSEFLHCCACIISFALFQAAHSPASLPNFRTMASPRPSLTWGGKASLPMCGPHGHNALVVSPPDAAALRLLPGMLAAVLDSRGRRIAVGFLWTSPAVKPGTLQGGHFPHRLVSAGFTTFALAKGITLHPLPGAGPVPVALAVTASAAAEEQAAALPSQTTAMVALGGALVCPGMALALPVPVPSLPTTPGGAREAQSDTVPQASPAQPSRTTGGDSPSAWSPSSPGLAYADSTTPSSTSPVLSLTLTCPASDAPVQQVLAGWTQVSVQRQADAEAAQAAPLPKDGPHSSAALTASAAPAALLQHLVRTLRGSLEPATWSAFSAAEGGPPPRGMLLHGPPGTGKSTLARQAARVMACEVVHLDGGALCGLAPQQARAAIAKAYACLPSTLQPDPKVRWLTHDMPAPASVASPSVAAAARESDPDHSQRWPSLARAGRMVIVDEVDALGSGRGGGGASAASTSLLQTLQGVMQSTGSSGKPIPIITVGTTNRQADVAPCLQAAGCLDSALAVPPPSSTSRLSILQGLFPAHLHVEAGDVPTATGFRAGPTRSYPHTLTQEQLQDIAERTNGYVAADLAGMAREAALSALHRAQQAAVHFSDIQHGLAKVQPSALRAVTVQVPSTAWTDVAGAEDAKQVLQEAVQWPLEQPELFAQAGVAPPIGVLLYGPPGTGKTLLAKALAHETRANFISVKGPELFSMYVGDSEKAVQALFARARAVAPCVVFIDEVDAMGRKRGGSASTGTSVGDRVLNQLLTEMDTLASAYSTTIGQGASAADWLASRVVVVGATNRPDTLDPALIRPGRLERLVHVGLPSAEARCSLLSAALRKVQAGALSEDVVAGDIAAALTSASGAEVAGVVRTAAMAAIAEDPNAPVLRQRHLLAAAQRLVPQATAASLQFYRDWGKQQQR